jgi:predicted permease
VAEQLVLSTVGGALGLAVAWAALRVFVRTAPLDLPRVSDVALDARVLAFAAATAVLTGIFVAVLPAWRTAGRDVEPSLRAGALSTTGDRGGMRTRGALLALQVALSLTLLVVTALLGASFRRLLTIDRGFVSDRVLIVPISMPASRYATNEARLAVYDRLLASIAPLPGVQSATTVSSTPLSGASQVNGIAPEGSTTPRGELPPANFRYVAPDFFRTLGIRIVRGRAFREGEGRRTGTMPALISASTAQRLWPGEDAIGKRFSRGIPDEAGFEVVGIVADARITSLHEAPPLMVYLPYWWRSRPTTTVAIKSAADPAALTSSVRRVVRDLDPDIAVGDARTLDGVVDASVAGRRYQMQLFVAFGAVALFIAALGVYAVTSYGVSRRRREMNIRVALGAARSQVVAMILRQGTTPIAIGVVVGIGGSLAVGRVVASLLFGVDARDPLVIGAVVLTVAMVGVATCALAARQGLRIDPASALREE